MLPLEGRRRASMSKSNSHAHRDKRVLKRKKTQKKRQQKMATESPRVSKKSFLKKLEESLLRSFLLY